MMERLQGDPVAKLQKFTGLCRINMAVNARYCAAQVQLEPAGGLESYSNYILLVLTVAPNSKAKGE